VEGKRRGKAWPLKRREKRVDRSTEYLVEKKLDIRNKENLKSKPLKKKNKKGQKQGNA